MKVLSKFLKEQNKIKENKRNFLKDGSVKKILKFLAIFFQKKFLKGKKVIHAFKLLLKKPAK